MADTLTPNIELTNQTEGGNNNTWGQIADANFERVDDVLGDVTEIVTTGGDTVLTDEQEFVAAIKVSGTLELDVTITFSGRGGFWIVANDTSGEHSVVCRLSGGEGVEIERGGAALVWCDGDDIRLGNPPAAVTPEATIASAETTDILGAGSEFIAISGTADIESFGTGPNRKRFVRATGEFKLVHHNTSLILPGGGADIEVAIGDTFIVVSDPSSNARVISYQRANGHALVEDATPDLDAIEAIADNKRGLLKKTGKDQWGIDHLPTSIIFSKDSGNTNVALATGILGDLKVDFDCEIQSVTLLADQSGSCVVDIWKAAYASYPPVDGNSICGSAEPEISNAAKSQDTSLAGWTKTISAGDILRFNLDSNDDIARLTIILTVKRFTDGA